MKHFLEISLGQSHLGVVGGDEASGLAFRVRVKHGAAVEHARLGVVIRAEFFLVSSDSV